MSLSLVAVWRRLVDFFGQVAARRLSANCAAGSRATWGLNNPANKKVCVGRSWENPFCPRMCRLSMLTKTRLPYSSPPDGSSRAPLTARRSQSESRSTVLCTHPDALGLAKPEHLTLTRLPRGRGTSYNDGAHKRREERTAQRNINQRTFYITRRYELGTISESYVGVARGGVLAPRGFPWRSAQQLRSSLLETYGLRGCETRL